MKHVLQWHITHKCNLRCSHCYQDEYYSDLDFNSLKKIFFDYLDFCNYFHFTPHINFTGGEPFACNFIFDLFDLVEKNNVTFGILTNGTLISKDICQRLRKYKNLSFVQISIDGDKKTHDKIRGNGNFKKATSSLKLLRKYNIQTMVSFTCHQDNYLQLKKVIHLMRYYKVDRFFADRLIPMGNNIEKILTTEQYQYVIKLLTKEQKRKGMIVHCNRALQFCLGSNDIYKCSAGKTLLTILANGDLLPCRRLPIVLGNVLNNSILSIVKDNSIIDDLNKDDIPVGCEKCMKVRSCHGGAKCLSYALAKNYHKKDVNCIF